MSGRRRRPAAAARRTRRGRRRRCCPAWPTSSASPRGVVVAAGMNDSHAGAFATGAFARGHAPVSASAPRRCCSTRSTTWPSTSTTRSSRCRARCAGHYLVWAENGMAGKVGRARARASSSTPPTSSATTRPTTPSPRSTPRSAAHRAGRRRRAVPPVARRLVLARRRPARCAAASSTCRSTPGRIDLVRAVVEGIAHNLALAAARRRGVHRATASTRSCSAAAPPARAQWARSSPTCSTARSRRCADPDHAVARAVGLVGARSATAALPARRPRPTSSTSSATLRARRRAPRPSTTDARRPSSRPRSRPSARSARPSTHDRRLEGPHEQRLPLRRALRRHPRHALRRAAPRARSSPSSRTMAQRGGRVLGDRASAPGRCTAATTSTTTS